MKPSRPSGDIEANGGELDFKPAREVGASLSISSNDVRPR
jgi:hypothetical protein